VIDHVRVVVSNSRLLFYKDSTLEGGQLYLAGVLIFGFISEAQIRAQLAYPAVPQAAYPPVSQGAYQWFSVFEFTYNLQRTTYNGFWFY